MRIIIAILAVTVIGIICAVMLSVASKVMAVKTDERTAELREALPGANCGACGYPGCDGYAAALAEGGVKTNLCIPGADAVGMKLSAILGVEFEDVEEKVAVVHCRGDCDATRDRVDYEGRDLLRREAFRRKGKRPYGCIGSETVHGLSPTAPLRKKASPVSYPQMHRLGLCAASCPNKIITVERIRSNRRFVRSRDKGAVTRNNCTAGCIACKRCEKECPVQAVAVENNLAVIDYAKCTGCGRCAEVCPVKCIALRDFRGVSGHQADAEPAAKQEV